VGRYSFSKFSADKKQITRRELFKLPVRGASKAIDRVEQMPGELARRAITQAPLTDPDHLRKAIEKDPAMRKSYQASSKSPKEMLKFWSRYYLISPHGKRVYKALAGKPGAIGGGLVALTGLGAYGIHRASRKRDKKRTEETVRQQIPIALQELGLAPKVTGKDIAMATLLKGEAPGGSAR